jgi:hypothetical protein
MLRSLSSRSEGRRIDVTVLHSGVAARDHRRATPESDEVSVRWLRVSDGPIRRSVGAGEVLTPAYF